MNELFEFVKNNVTAGPCQCGRCIDLGNTEKPTGHVADMIFFLVSLNGDPNEKELRILLANHEELYRMFDGQEHNYIELGGWAGSQEFALMLMGAGSLMGLWELRTPRTMLPAGLPDELVMQMAGQGMVAIRHELHAPVQQQG